MLPGQSPLSEECGELRILSCLGGNIRSRTGTDCLLESFGIVAGPQGTEVPGKKALSLSDLRDTSGKQPPVCMSRHFIGRIAAKREAIRSGWLLFLAVLSGNEVPDEEGVLYIEK